MGTMAAATACGAMASRRGRSKPKGSLDNEVEEEDGNKVEGGGRSGAAMVTKTTPSQSAQEEVGRTHPRL